VGPHFSVRLQPRDGKPDCASVSSDREAGRGEHARAQHTELGALLEEVMRTDPADDVLWRALCGSRSLLGRLEAEFN
jgi:hypothetical protein